MKKIMSTAVIAAALTTQGFAAPGCGSSDPACNIGAGTTGEVVNCKDISNVTKEQLSTLGAKFSYAYGKMIAEQTKMMKAQLDSNIDGELDSRLLAAGLLHSICQKESLLTDEEGKAVMMEVQTLMQAKMQAEQTKQMEAMQAKGAVAKEAGEAFLAENKSKEGITVTASGLQYEILQNAEGDKPKATDTVEVHYKGTLLDGTEFDSSYKRGKPIKFPLNGVIKGWTEGVQLMAVGSKYKFYIPSELAYGVRGAGANIPPNSALIFEVELISIGK